MNTIQTIRRPADVLNALRLLTISLLVESLAFAFSGDYSVGSVLGIVAGAVLSFWLLRQVHTGANWARFVIAVIVGLGAVTLLTTFRRDYAQNPGETAIDVISTLLTFVAVVLLFTKNSNQWFNRR